MTINSFINFINLFGGIFEKIKQNKIKEHDWLYSLILQMLISLLRWHWIENIEQKN